MREQRLIKERQDNEKKIADQKAAAEGKNQAALLKKAQLQQERAQRIVEQKAAKEVEEE